MRNDGYESMTRAVWSWQIELPARIRSLRADGDRLVAVPMPPHYVGNATSPLLLDLKHYRIVAQLDGHVGRVFSARWVAGDQILTAGADGTARLWDGSTGQLRQTYRGKSRILTTAMLAPDGLVMAGGADGLLQFWDRGSGRLLWALRAHAAATIGLQVEGSDIVTGAITGEFSRWTLPNSDQVIRTCSDHEHCAIVLR
jgi:WD40 repeat protein